MLRFTDTVQTISVFSACIAFVFILWGDFRSLIFRIKSLFRKDEEGVVIVEREEFAREMKEKFRGNTELLKAIEKGLNRYAKKNEFISLTD